MNTGAQEVLDVDTAIYEAVLKNFRTELRPYPLTFSMPRKELLRTVLQMIHRIPSIDERFKLFEDAFALSSIDKATLYAEFRDVWNECHPPSQHIEPNL